MIALVKSEWIKATSTKLWWILFIVAAALTVLSTLPLLLLSASEIEGEAIPGTDLSDPSVMQAMWASMGSATVIALILGVIGFTGEYRHRTISDTFLTEPRRGRVIASKAVAFSGLSALLAVLTCVVVIGTALLLLPSRAHSPIDWWYVAQTVGAVIVAYVLYAVLGICVGCLITNQVAAVALCLLWVMLIESIIVAFWPDVGRWLPGGALSGVLQVESLDGTPFLAPWLGALVLLGYAILFAAAAMVTTLRRDIT